MDDPNTGTLVEADEDILTYTASDEALEAAAGRIPYELQTQLLWHTRLVIGCC
jgi:hypothetical protein